MKHLTSALVLVFSCCLITLPAHAASTAFVGTGGKTGVYYPVGRVICQMVNQRSIKYGYRYEARKSHGSVANINAVMSGNRELGFAQSDRQYEAYNGLAEWRSIGPQKDLRSVFSIYTEAVTLVASEKSQINSLDGLKGKSVNIGHRGSGQHKNSLDVLEAVNIRLDTLHVREVSTRTNQKMMQDGKIDAFFYTIGHPNTMIQDLSRDMKLSIIPLTGPGIDALIRKYPFYTRTRIPGALYPSITHRADIDSIGVTATLVTSRKLNRHVIYSLVKEVFEHLDELKGRHPALRGMNKNNMLKGLSAPLHEGAALYYREAGLL